MVSEITPKGWVCLSVAACVGAIALRPQEVRTVVRSYALEASAPLPASLYFEPKHAALDDGNLQSLAAIASAVRSSATPVVVAAYADQSGNRDQNIRLAQKRATGVRDALVIAGVPTLRVVLVSPTVAANNDAPRVEVSLVRGVRAFPSERKFER